MCSIEKKKEKTNTRCFQVAFDAFDLITSQPHAFSYVPYPRSINGSPDDVLRVLWARQKKTAVNRTINNQYPVINCLSDFI